MTPAQTKILAAVTAALTAAVGVFFADDPMAKQLCGMLSTFLTGYLVRRHGDLAPLPGSK